MFLDRVDAGRRLAERLRPLRDDAPIVVGLPRGGVVVAAEIARTLAAPLDVVVVRKLGAPGHAELGIGAVAGGDPPEVLLNEPLVRTLGVSRDHLEREIAAQLAEVRRREDVLRAGRPARAVAGRTVVLVDDGIATGGTVAAALRALRHGGPRRVVLAVPVAPADALAALADHADEIVCLAAPAHFDAVGQFYSDFRQTSDDEVMALLAGGTAEAHRLGSFR